MMVIIFSNFLQLTNMLLLNKSLLARSMVCSAHLFHQFHHQYPCPLTDSEKYCQECLAESYSEENNPLLSITYNWRRADFEFKYQKWTIKDRKEVSWSDEIQINQIRSNKHGYVWKLIDSKPTFRNLTNICMLEGDL